MEVEAIDDGIIGKLLVSEGEEGIKVNTPIAVLTDSKNSLEITDELTVKTVTEQPNVPKETPKLEQVKHPSDKYEKFNLQLSFSYTFKGANSFRHTDKISQGYKVRYGGLVYLYPEPIERSGTTLYLNETTYLDNKYNRFVLYNSNIEHEPTDNFGSNINNSRLVLTIFYDMA